MHSIAIIAFLTLGQESALHKRYGYDVQPLVYAQKTPQEAVTSIVRALDRNRYDYLMAHLADPRFVDPRVKAIMKDITQGSEEGRAIVAFDKLVKEIKDHFLEDAALIREMRLFAAQADWDVEGDRAVGVNPQLQGRQVVLRRIEDRWFLENTARKAK